MTPTEREALGAQGGEPERLAALARRHVGSAFELAGWDVALPAPSSGSPDLVCRRGALTYAVELRAASGRVRRALLRGLLADAALQSRAKAVGLAARPLAVLAAPALSDGIVAELVDYMRAYGEDLAWGAIDARGRWDLFGEGLEDLSPPEPSQLVEADPASSSRGRRALANPFSDLGQWMLKVLVASHMPHVEGHAAWNGSPIRGVSDLAARASVSPSSASQFLASLENLEFVERARGRVRLVRLQALLEAWRNASQGTVVEQPARFLLSAKLPLERLSRLLVARGTLEKSAQPGHGAHPLLLSGPSGRRACLGLFAAVEKLGAAVVRGAPVHLYSESLSADCLRDLELHDVEHAAEAEVLVRRPRYPESIFRGSLAAPDGAPVADLLQCWLDLSFHPARGAEQAEAIAHRLGLAEWNE